MYEQPYEQTWSPTSWQKLHYRLLRPAIFVVPLWLAFGKLLFGGPFGWASIIYFFAVNPFLILYHILISYIAARKNRLRSDLDPEDFFVTDRLAAALTIYYSIHILWQFLLEDGGDEGPHPSIAERWFGISSTVSLRILNSLFVCFLVDLLVILTLVFFEPILIEE